MSKVSHGPTATEVQQWLVTRMATLLDIEPTETLPLDTFHSYGLSSREMVALSGELEEWLGRTLSPTLLWDYPTIEALAHALATSPTSEPAAQIPYVHSKNEPLALIGMGCRFPGASGPQKFWQLLCDGRNAISEDPRRTWTIRKDDEGNEHPQSGWGGFLADVDLFDAAFFGIAPREAVSMDPQQRLLLEVTWEALEDAGQDVARLRGHDVGVFIGIATNDYSRMHLSNLHRVDAYAATGSAFSIAANRLSYVFDWHGPSLAVDTACSSSLVAVHLACQSIWDEEASLALAGGVNLLLDPTFTISLSQAGVLAADGQCKTFDRRADGYVRGEGVGVVVIKRLAEAQRDRDPIYAVIRGSAVGQDGHTNGLMAPSRQAQEKVLRRAYQRASVSPDQVSYIEAHGTGTLLGDPIEVQALHAILSVDRAAGSYCRLGSVKTNIGHLEPAAGIAGLMKVALMLKHRQLPPSLNFSEPNPYIAFDQMPLRVQTALEPWPVEAPLLAGVSSFGFGGTNAHVVVEGISAEQEEAIPTQQAALLVLSARHPQALHALASRYAAFLATQEATRWEAVCATASLRRTHHEHRLALVADSVTQAHDRLQAFLQQGYTPAIVLGQASAKQSRQLVFVFSGHGSQWRGMGRALLEQETVFREVVEQCDQAMRPYVPWSLLEAFLHDREVYEVDVLQPMLFALSVALAALLQSWGIVPAAVVGQSMGEVAAAYIAGILRLPDACRVICERSRLLRHVSGCGAMLAVDLSPEQAQDILAGYDHQIAIAVENGPRSLVLSGTREAIEHLRHYLRQRDVPCQRVQTDVAFHSPQMQPLQAELCGRLADIQPRQGELPLYSTVDGTLRAGETCHADYWGRNLREPVRFAQALDSILQDGYTLFLEVSPHPLLVPTIEQALQTRHLGGTALSTLRRGRPERTTLLNTAGTLYTLGYDLTWSRLFDPSLPHIALPTYPWQHQRFWSPETTPISAQETFHTDRVDSPSTQPNVSQRAAHTRPGALCEKLLKLDTEALRLLMLEGHIREQIGQILHLELAHIDLDTPLMALGFDSITALELKKRLQSELALTLPVTLVWHYPTVHMLAAYIDQQLVIYQGSSRPEKSGRVEGPCSYEA